LESFIYLASGSYDGDPNYGSSNFYISSCVGDTIFHTAYQCIGGRNNTFQGCSAVNCASGPFVLFMAADVRIIGCTADKCLTKTWIGIGSLGDNFGQVYKAGKQNVVDTGGYELTCLNNTFTQCGVGRSLSGNSTTFYFNDNGGLTSSRFIIDGNHSDATVGLFNPDSITEVLAQYPAAAGGGPSQSEFDALEVDVVSNTSGVAANVVTLGSQATTIAANTASAATNATAITGKQATLTWATVGDDHETRPVTSKNIKSYIDGAGGGDVYLASANTFTANQAIKANSNVKLTLEHTGYGVPLELGNNYGDSGLTYVGRSAIKFNGNRIAASGGCTLFGLPVVSTKDTTNAAHGCLVVDDSAGANSLKLYFNTGGAWVNLS